MSRARMKNLRRARAGFSLIELLVAMVAGLIVTIAVLGLAREATTVFHEEIRMSNAEMSLRLASDRVRRDLQAAAFLSTPNLYDDPLVARDPLKTNFPKGGTSAEYDKSPFDELFNLAGVRYEPGGSYAAPNYAQPPSLDPNGVLQTVSKLNALQPDQLFVSGNLTTPDEYIGVVTDRNAVCGGGSGVKVQLQADDPAVQRLVGYAMPTNGDAGAVTPPAPSTTTMVNRTIAAFLPGLSGIGLLNASSGLTQAVRVSDSSGRFYNYAPICNIFYDTTANAVALILSGANAVLPATTGAGVSGGFSGFAPVTISPIQTVRWSLRCVGTTNGTCDQNDPRFELVREWIALNGTAMPNAEVVAEYVVDLKFAFTAISPVNPELLDVQSYPYGSTDIQKMTAYIPPGATPTALRTPQRLRSIRFRIAARGATADRDTDVPDPNADPAGAATTLYRYLLPSGKYARVRTITSEVALENQWRSF
jgi:type II secretory pathway pseudopilin PulG